MSSGQNDEDKIFKTKLKSKNNQLAKKLFYDHDLVKKSVVQNENRPEVEVKQEEMDDLSFEFDQDVNEEKEFSYAIENYRRKVDNDRERKLAMKSFIGNNGIRSSSKENVDFRGQVYNAELNIPDSSNSQSDMEPNQINSRINNLNL